MGIIEWLNANSGAVIAIATVVLVIFAGYYIYLMWRLLRVNNTPEVVVSLRLHEVHVNLVLLCIENIGTGAARDLQFTINPPSIENLDLPFEEIGYLQNGIAYFEPGRKIEQFIVGVTNKLDELKQTPFEVAITYRDSVNQKHERVFNLDFGENEGMANIGTPPLYEIAKTIKEIKKDLNDVANGIRKPVILTESVSENSIRNHTDFLQSRISGFPPNTQQRILQKLEFFIDEQNREIREKTVNDEEIVSEENSSRRGDDTDDT